MKEMNTNIHTQTIIDRNWNPETRCFDFTFTFAFQTKAEYVEFRQLWKANYAALGASLRGLKASIKSTMRQCEYAGKYQVELHLLKAQARCQLAMRKAAKVEAARQFLAARQIAT